MTPKPLLFPFCCSPCATKQSLREELKVTLAKSYLFLGPSNMTEKQNTMRRNREVRHVSENEVWVSRALTVNGGGMPRALIKDV
jgi:predicted adenine nucleotide alpha hydrolase (AANH) superfamily ATPase